MLSLTVPIWLLIVLMIGLLALSIWIWQLQQQIALVKSKANQAQSSKHARMPANLKAPMRAKGKTLEASADEARELNQTFRKFVPRQFVEHFAKHGSDTLALGRADEDKVAILFCDIRGFTGLSEHLSPQELMNFLNSYFVRMNAPIHENHGFIDKFIGDAIMALFDHPDGSNKDKACDALHAALGLRKALDLYNQHRANSGYEPIEIGIGVHFGSVVLGTVGSDDRMDTTVVGDNVNIAQRLESLAPTYDVDIVVSEAIIDTAKAYESFDYRLIDWVKLKGRSEAVKIYEVFSHADDATKFSKHEVASLIQRGIDARITNDIALAKSLFNEACVISSHDPVVLYHCKTLARASAQEQLDWSGATFIE